MKTKRTRVLLAATLTLMGAAHALGEVVDSSPGGFTSKHTTKITASADEVFHALVDEVDEWWDPDHTFSGDSANLYIEAEPGGCFCEKLGDSGGVEHLEVVFVEPGRQLRMRGGLGPLQGMGVSGSLTWTIEHSPESTEVTLTYAVGGYHAGGLHALAEPVDTVLGGQLARLKKFIEEATSKR
jgi:uncharacterized protein YndB with AHSA1/START domain